jgi:hypothetical protein
LVSKDSLTSVARKLKGRVPTLRTFLLRVLLPGGFLAVAVLIALHQVDLDLVWPVIGLVLLALLFAAMPTGEWGRLASKVSKANLGPVSFELASSVREVARSAPREEGGGSNEDEETMVDLRLRLEAKLAYVAKHLLVRDGRPPAFLTVGSLQYDGYLTSEEAHTAAGILTTRDEEVDALPGDEARKFREDASTFVNGVRASVFWGMVKQTLKTNGWWVADVPGSPRRSDLLAHRGGRWFRVAPVFATDRDSELLKIGKTRLEETERSYIHRRVVVIPDRSRSHTTSPEADPAVVRLCRLSRVLTD